MFQKSNNYDFISTDKPRLGSINIKLRYRMKKIASLLLFLTFLVLLMSGFGSSPSSTATPVPQELGKTIVVNSIADSGPDTLRQALLDAQSGNTITFAPAVFPPSAPATIYLLSNLPGIEQDYLTIDASEAGVILDGSKLLSSPAYGLQIYSDRNTIKGLQIINFSEGGIAISDAHYNTVGGDRNFGSGPIGQGNMISGNNIGIGLWGRASFNIITGNLIGTDSYGVHAWGNGIGITISEGANRNTIGSNNVIAYNGENGINIRDSSSIGNTIIQNSIHDNQGEGICLYQGSNADLDAPLIFDFDLVAGTMAGVASPNCTVEIFSDGKKEGEIYEGRTTADGAGTFNFNKRAPFSGPYLTATATDPDGNTSAFSAPTSGTSRSVILQEGNNLLRTQLQHKQSKELEDNRIGDMMSLKPIHEWSLDTVINTGLKWLRLTIDWFDWDEVDWNGGEYSKYSVNPKQDKAITDLVDNDIKITYTLVFWDPESPGQEEEEGYSRFRTEDEIQRYLDYAQFIVSHFKGKIEYYEILNEPITGSGTQQSVEVEDYINLVKRVVPVIRKEDPKAKIVVGAIPNLYQSGDDYEYLLILLESEIMPLVDGISYHPMHGVSPDYELREDYYKYPSVVREIKGTASAHGFKGEYMADELVWRTSENPLESEPWTYSKIASAKYFSRGIIMNLGMDITTGLAGTSHDFNLPKMIAIQNLCNIMAGTEPTSLPIEIQSEATNIRNYNFSLPNGDKLIALWTDGVAVDEDLGVKAILTFPGIAAEKVIGIDILNSFEQEMITDVEDGNLVVRDLLVKDYPIILRFTNTTP
jgi:hypothetical protein